MGSSKEKVAEEGISARVISPSGESDEADSRLKQLGYKQEMKRSLGMISVLGLAFAIMVSYKRLKPLFDPYRHRVTDNTASTLL
jgi:hypothetical protein